MAWIAHSGDSDHPSDVKVNRRRDARHLSVQPSRPDRAAARAFANFGAAPKSAGMPMSHADCQITAIDRTLGACVATRNDGDFEHFGINVINPWPAPADPDEAPTEVATGVGFVMLGPGGQNMIAIDCGANAQFSTPTWTGPQARFGPGQPCHHPQSGAGPGPVGPRSVERVGDHPERDRGARMPGPGRGRARRRGSAGRPPAGTRLLPACNADRRP